MTPSSIYQSIVEAKKKGRRQFTVLIDPDKTGPGKLEKIVELAVQAGVDYLFAGGSLIVNDKLDDCLQTIRQNCDIPTILFPGNAFQLSDQADGILFLSLISGRNPELLIGQHVITAPYLKNSSLEIIPTGYLLIDGGAPTSVSYMSNTIPIPADKDEIALCTAMAGEMLGLKMIYLEAGSGAKKPVSPSMIKTVSQAIEVPLMVGGGIRSPESARSAIEAGADVIVVGNAIEKQAGLLLEMAEAVHSFLPGFSRMGPNGKGG